MWQWVSRSEGGGGKKAHSPLIIGSGRKRGGGRVDTNHLHLSISRREKKKRKKVFNHVAEMDDESERKERDWNHCHKKKKD